MEDLVQTLEPEEREPIFMVPSCLGEAPAADVLERIEACVLYAKGWEVIKAIRSAILKLLEGLREQGAIRHSLEARVKILINVKVMNMSALQNLHKELRQNNQTIEQFFKELLIVSQVEYDEIDDYNQEDDDQELEEELEEDGCEATAIDGLLVHVGRAVGDKCPRCWQWEATEHEFRLCKRCQQVVARLRGEKQ